jgi:hypothetical protein
MAKDKADTSTDIAVIMGDVAPEVVSSDDAARQIAERILTADDLSGIFAEDSTVASKDMVGIGIRVTEVRIMQSDLVEGVKSYMLIDAEVLDSGEKVTINTGSRNIMAKLWQCKAKGFLPVEVTITEISAGRPGENAPLGLKAAADGWRPPRGTACGERWRTSVRSEAWSTASHFTSGPPPTR